MAWIIVSKFADHLPLYRLEQIAASQQVPLPVLPYPHGLAW
ncbi:MAG: transposase [Moraxellaceae bacterium]|nr:transposase [Moraxellaceae bacterium]